MSGQRNRTGRPCSLCGKPISEGRLQVLPNVTTCIDCAKRNPPKKLDARQVDLSQASPINRNGFAPTD